MTIGDVTVSIAIKVVLDSRHYASRTREKNNLVYLICRDFLHRKNTASISYLRLVAIIIISIVRGREFSYHQLVSIFPQLPT